MAIAGAAITAAPSDVEELQAGAVATMLFSLFALFLGGASHMGHGSNSTKYEVNEKRDKEKKGVDNSGFDGKKETDIEKGDEKDEKWKNNYVPYDEESKEKESS